MWLLQKLTLPPVSEIAKMVGCSISGLSLCQN